MYVYVVYPRLSQTATHDVGNGGREGPAACTLPLLPGRRAARLASCHTCRQPASWWSRGGQNTAVGPRLGNNKRTGHQHRLETHQI